MVGAFVVVVVVVVVVDVVDVVDVVLSTAYFVGVGVFVPSVRVVGLIVDVVVVDVVVVVVVVTSKPLLMVTLLTANPVVVRFLLMPSMRSYKVKNQIFTNVSCLIKMKFYLNF